MQTRRDWIFRTGSLLVLMAAVLSGCATRQSGYKISEETIAFIQPGVTTKAEVVENLGPPLLELQDIRVLAYSWGKVRVAGGSAEARQEAMQSRQMNGYSSYATVPPPIEGGELVEASRWICCVAWDENNHVTRVERLKLEGAPSLEKAVRAWAEAGR